MIFRPIAPRLSLACLALLVLAHPVLAQKKKQQTPAVKNAVAATPLGEVSRPASVELPKLEPAGLHSASPSLLLQQSPEAGVFSRAQKAARDADRHFNYGKFFLQEGKPEDARREFDLAIDALLDVPEDLPDRAVVDRKFDELVRRIYRYDLEELGSGGPQGMQGYTQSPLAGILDLTFPIDPRLKDRTVARLQSSQSQLPLVVNDAVLSYINYFTSPRGSKTLLFGLKRAGRYRDMISRVLKEEGVPQELIHLAQAESGFMPRAVSPKAAAGMWQFVRARGKEYGLDSGREIDERLDPEKATRAAARHLRDLYNQLGDWYLAMAAYNCGPYCVERAVQRTGYADFWELRGRNALPKETRNYVPAILAIAIVSKDLEAYGLEMPEAEPPMQFDTINVTAPTNVALIADAADVPVAEIRELNPSLLKSVVPVGYEVRVPTERATTVTEALESVPEEKRAAWRLHRVASGDTLASIARRYSTAANSIVAVNQNLDSTFFEAPEDGELLLIPAAPVKEQVTAKRTSVRRNATRSRAGSAVQVRSKRSTTTKRVASNTAKKRAIAR